MWIGSVPAAAPVVPGAAPAAPPAEGEAAFGDALDASLLDEQGTPAVPEAGGSKRPAFDQRALAAWLLTGRPVANEPEPMPGLEEAPSETDAPAEDDLDDSAAIAAGDASGIAIDPLLVVPVTTLQQRLEGTTVELSEAAAERPAAGDSRLMAVVTQGGAGGQDAQVAQDDAAEPVGTETAETVPEHTPKAAEPQHAFRQKPEAAVRKDEAMVTAMASPGTKSLEEAPSEHRGQPSPAVRLANLDGATPVGAKPGAAATQGADAPAVVAVAEPSATESAAPAAETAVAASAAGQRGEREVRDTTIGTARVPVNPIAAQVQPQMGGGDAQSFEQESRRSPAAQRLAAALSMTGATDTRESASGSAPVFSLPGQPAVAPAPMASPAVVVPSAPVQIDPENAQNLVQAMRVTAKAGGWEATVRLKPEHLGEVTIALRVDGKNVSAAVQAESAGVRQWLMSQEDAVRSGMSEHGLLLDRFTVSRDGQRREADEQQPQRQQRRRAPRQATVGNEPRFEVVA
jgi:flagellar hook-length control protein FliK